MTDTGANICVVWRQRLAKGHLGSPGIVASLSYIDHYFRFDDDGADHAWGANDRGVLIKRPLTSCTVLRSKKV